MNNRSSLTVLKVSLFLGLFLLSVFDTGCAALSANLESEGWTATIYGERQLSGMLGLLVPFEVYNPADYEKMLDRMSALGLNKLRIPVHWANLEPGAGALDKAYLERLDCAMQAFARRGMDVTIFFSGSPPWNRKSAPVASDRCAPQDFGSYIERAGWLLKRYPQLKALQIWNEPNSPGFWAPTPDPSQYSQLFLASYKRLKPQFKQLIGLAGMAYYSNLPNDKSLMFERLFPSGCLKTADFVSYHPYFALPEGATREGDFITTANWLNSSLRALGAREIWAGEWGWSTYNGQVEEQPLISQAQQADYILKRLTIFLSMDFNRAYLFGLADLPWPYGGRDAAYGLLDNHFNPKPSYRALAYYLRLLAGRLQPTGLPVLRGKPQGLYCLNLKRSDGTNFLLFWGAKPGALSVSCRGQALLHNPLEQSRKRLVTKGEGTRLEAIVVRPTLQILEYRP